ncbi:MAG: 1-(5-phosphoribosyl)-5-[(5-phosphoribosylamino)methylideneamino]imidazole-4-carboxamide isomerase [Sandaracinaceae bacterium]|nr:1-(5-phosphoribosyl)-5-[(5-phosphoribosylamino)methylideneamino]imidazole-4-carboxamide isomerase [Sandaracinaceae bacterium]
MELIPAIDLLGGRVVRLHKGEYAAATEYSADPVAVALGFAEAGAARLHVVDLDGARGEPSEHPAIIRQIVERAPLAVQVGGGIRDRDTAVRWLEAGAARVVLGTVAVRRPEVAAALCADHPAGVVVAIDARGEEVAVDGWRESGGVSVRALAERAAGWGAAAILYTDIERDGTGEGPAVERTAALQRDVAPTVIASGGIGALAHLVALRDAGVRAAVCGRALYEGAFTLAEGLERLRGAP